MIDALCRGKSLRGEQTDFGTRGVSSDGYFGFDSDRISHGGARIDSQSTAGRPDGNFRTAVGMRDCISSDEREQAGHWPDLNRAAQAGTPSGVSASRTHGRVDCGVTKQGGDVK